MGDFIWLKLLLEPAWASETLSALGGEHMHTHAANSKRVMRQITSLLAVLLKAKEKEMRTRGEENSKYVLCIFWHSPFHTSAIFHVPFLDKVQLLFFNGATIWSGTAWSTEYACSSGHENSVQSWWASMVQSCRPGLCSVVCSGCHLEKVKIGNGISLL